jgi:hypothetical protein
VALENFILAIVTGWCDPLEAVTLAPAQIVSRRRLAF